MRRLSSVVLTLILIAASNALAPSADAAKRGKVIGGLAHQMPSWFKDSFLDIREDAGEAAQTGKHVLLFMTLNGCPYCTKMIDKVFAGDKDYISKHFDSIGINIKGSRMVTPPDGVEVSEKAYAQKLRVVFTPTIIFLDGDAKPIYRINGYWNGTMFRRALEYVNSQSYKTMKLGAFIKAKAQTARSKSPRYKFRDHPLLAKVQNFSKLKQPVAVLFEDKNCTACGKLHDNILSRKDIKAELRKFVFTRLDAYSNDPIIDINGNKTTAAAWARKLAVTANPTIIVFDEGKERQRIGAELYAFHFQYALRYVSGRHYENYDTWIKYLNVQQENILKSGKNIDIGDQPADAPAPSSLSQ